MRGTDGYRYPGPNEFEDTAADHLPFSGRNDEVNAITQQIVGSRLLVLYGSSGLGKSSLLKAGVYPKLRENNFCPIRVRITNKLGCCNCLRNHVKRRVAMPIWITPPALEPHRGNFSRRQCYADPGNLEYLAGLSRTQIEAGDKLAEENNPAAAFIFYSDSEESLRKAIAAADKDFANNYRSQLYDLIYKHIAPLQVKQQDMEAAIQTYARATKIRQDEVIAEPKNLTFRANLAKAYQDVGDDLQDEGQLAEAKTYYEPAIEVRREVIKLQSTPTAWDNLGNTIYASLAPLSKKQNNISAALNYYRQAADAESHAVALDPQNAVYLSNMGYAYQAIGNTLWEDRDQAAAEKEYDQSEQWFQKSILLDKTTPSSWYGLTLTAESIAQIHEEAGDRSTAKQKYDSALQAIIKAGELDATEKKYSDERASIETKIRQLALP